MKTELKYPLSSSQLVAIRKLADERDAKTAVKDTAEGKDVAEKGTRNATHTSQQ